MFSCLSPTQRQCSTTTKPTSHRYHSKHNHKNSNLTATAEIGECSESSVVPPVSNVFSFRIVCATNLISEGCQQSRRHNGLSPEPSPRITTRPIRIARIRHISGADCNAPCRWLASSSSSARALFSAAATLWRESTTPVPESPGLVFV